MTVSTVCLPKFLVRTCPRSRLGLHRVPGALRPRLWWIYCSFTNVFTFMIESESFKNQYWRSLLYVCQFLVRTCPRSRLGLHRVPGALRPRLWWGQTLSKVANIVEANWDRGKSKLPGSPWKLNAKPWSRAEKEVCQYTTILGKVPVLCSHHTKGQKILELFFLVFNFSKYKLTSVKILL